MYKFSNLSRDRMKGVDPVLIQLVEIALLRSPIDFGIAWMGGKRTAEQQYKLYKDDVTTKDGYENESKHQYGKAIDILPYVNGNPDMTERYYLIIIGVIFSCADELGINIRSGANWDEDRVWISDQRFKDLPHIELI